MSTVIVKTGLSSTVKSAQSKKCRLLKSVRENEMNPKVAKAIRNADPMLSSVLTEAEIDNAKLGLKPSRGSSRGSIELEVEIDD